MRSPQDKDDLKTQVQTANMGALREEKSKGEERSGRPRKASPTNQRAGLPDKNRRDPHKPGQSPPLRGPEDVELFLDVGEVFIAGGEGGFAMDG
jgi:hypothetical protein